MSVSYGAGGGLSSTTCPSSSGKGGMGKLIVVSSLSSYAVCAAVVHPDDALSEVGGLQPL